MNPNNKSIADSINQLMNSDPRRFAEWMNSGACLGTLDQIAQAGIEAQQSPIRPPFANYGGCVNLNERLLGETRGTEPIIYQCRYDRERARQYALQWGSSDAFKDATPGMQIVAKDATDCANFASQVLAAGGFRPTDNWHYVRDSVAQDIENKKPTWSGANLLLAWLTGGYYGESATTDITPLAQPIEKTVDIGSVDSVVAATQEVKGIIRPGDMIFYETPDNYYDHVAIVVGWGSPYNYSSGHIQRVASDDNVPWIVDHGDSSYPEGRIRPYNYQKGYYNPDNWRNNVSVHFVPIPDNFRLSNVMGNGIWHW